MLGQGLGVFSPCNIATIGQSRGKYNINHNNNQHKDISSPATLETVDQSYETKSLYINHTKILG